MLNTSTWSCIILFVHCTLFVCLFGVVSLWVDASVEPEYEDLGEYKYEDPALCPSEDPTCKMIVPESRHYFCYARFLASTIMFRYLTLKLLASQIAMKASNPSTS